MYERSGCVEEEAKGSGGSNGDPESWLSNSTHTLSPTHLRRLHHPPSGSGSSNNFGRDLVDELAAFVPLVESLIDQKARSSFTRRGSLIYTKTPSRDSRKNGGKSKNAAKSTFGSKHSDKEQGKDSKNDTGDCSTFAANMAMEKDREELNSLKQQFEDLQQKMLEKDELLKAAEIYKNQMVSVQSHVDELKRYAAEKDSLIKTSQRQLNDAKIKLADKQAALEKLQWESRTSNQKAERLKEELNSMQSQISTLMLLFEGLSKDDPINPTEDYDISPHYADHFAEMDDMDEIGMQNMEEARIAYIEAIEVVKERQDEESLEAAAKARLHLQSLTFRSNDQ